MAPRCDIVPRYANEASLLAPNEQTRVSEAMAAYVQGRHAPLAGIISTGDQFYPAGASGVADRHFKETFEERYSAPSLRNATWLMSTGAPSFCDRCACVYESS